MNSDYRTSIIRQLRDQQVRFAPREKKVEQVNRAERLINEIDPKRVYSYEYLCFRITEYRPESNPQQTMLGDQVRHDLRLFVEDVSDAANILAKETGEPVHTVEELSKMFNVSTKTIQRWRDQGLVSRRIIFDKRKRVGFLHSSVERFVYNNEDKVKRGERFSQLSDDERADIIERGRRLARAGGCPSEVARRVAGNVGRSVETVRYTIKQFDQQFPHLAVFPNSSAPLSTEIRERIYQEFRAGESVDNLSRKYDRTATSIYRIINEARAMRIMELPLDHMLHPDFTKPGAEKKIMADMPEAEEAVKKTRPPAGLPQYLAALYEVPLLTREQEVHQFRKYNYLKYRASKLREELDPAAARTTTMDKIESLYHQAVELKNQIVQANLRLVVSIAKRHVSVNDDFFSLVSDGNVSLFRAVEKFDCSRGNKFSTYASWALMKNFARSIPDEIKQRDRFRTSQDETFGFTMDERTDQYELERAQHVREEQIEKILSRLDEREQKIIISRYGLNHEQQPLTLKEVGEEMGVTKERVRQIEARALNKLRSAAHEEKIEIPD